MKFNIIVSAVFTFLTLILALIIGEDYNTDVSETFYIFYIVSIFMFSLCLNSIFKLIEEKYGDRISNNNYATKILKYGLPVMSTAFISLSILGLIILELESRNPTLLFSTLLLIFSTMLGTVFSCIVYPDMNEYIIKCTTSVIKKKTKKPDTPKIKCSNCDVTFPKGVKFCPNCGTAVENKDYDLD